MTATSRIELARAAYARALEAARARNAPAAWRRLVRAGQNLRDALTELALLARGARHLLLALLA